MKKILPALALLSSLALNQPKEAYADLGINLFPNGPIKRAIMADPEIYKTEIKIPLNEETPDLLSEPIESFCPYISLGGDFPLLSFDIKSKKLLYAMPKKELSTPLPVKKELSDKVLSASLIGSGKLAFSGDKSDYGVKLELFLSSPMVDDCLSDGNRMYVVGGFEGKGSDLSRFSGKNLSQIAESFVESHSFFADVYIVPKSPWSDQFLIFRVGANNLFASNGEKPNVSFSTTFELPSIFGEEGAFKNFKLSPYLSLYVHIPMDYPDRPVKGSAQLGAKLSGESKNALFGFVQADYTENSPLAFSAGIKMNF